MKTVCIIFFTLKFVFCISQNPLNASYKGLKDGEHIDRYSNGKIRTQWIIKNGNVVGQHINYFRNGSLKSIEQFDNGLFDGINFELNINGDTITTETYKHDSIFYYKTFTYYKTGELKETKQAFFQDSIGLNLFPKSKTHLSFVDYDIFKVITTKYNKNVFKSFYKSGKLKSISYGIRNQMQGVYQEFYESGKLKISVNYLNNKMSGDYIEYNTEGKIIKTIKYLNGVKQ